MFAFPNFLTKYTLGWSFVNMYCENIEQGQQNNNNKNLKKMEKSAKFVLFKYFITYTFQKAISLEQYWKLVERLERPYYNYFQKKRIRKFVFF